MPRTGQPASRHIAAVERAAAVLFELAEAHGELGTNELARRLEISASTVSRLLATLTSSGLVEHVPRSGRYRLGLRLGFRATEGFSERVVFREFFPNGLTALDNLDEATLGTKPNLSHLTARQEVRRMIEELKLPIDERGRRRAAARAEWVASQDKPLETDDLIADEPATRPIAPGGRDATL